jgi:hypothetical protein
MVGVKDLFEIFPDLPWLPRRSAEAGVREAQRRAALARRMMETGVAARRALAHRVREIWNKRRGK